MIEITFTIRDFWPEKYRNGHELQIQKRTLKRKIYSSFET